MKRFYFLLFLLFPLPLSAQYVLKEADEQFKLYNYTKAISLYEQAYQKKKTLHAAERLAISYFRILNYVEAEKWYAITVAYPESHVENSLFYARILQNRAKYGEAKTQFQNYICKKGNVPAAQSRVWLASCDSGRVWLASPEPTVVTNLAKLNSGFSDWAGVPYQGGVVFTSDRDMPDPEKDQAKRPFLRFDKRLQVPPTQFYGWTGTEYLRLYFQADSSAAPVPFRINAGTRYHIASPAFNAAEDEIFFTLTRIPEKLPVKKGVPATIHVEIYSAKKAADGNWANPTPFFLNKPDTYSVGDPFLTAKGDTLYFASDMPGGAGGLDIYRCTRRGDGSWNAPVNLKALNTPGDERSPVQAADGTMYFSSNGRIGMGGLDIFRQVNGGAIQNMKAPVNSPADDFAVSLNSQRSQMEYLSSNRATGQGRDDIYRLAFPQPPAPPVVLARDTTPETQPARNLAGTFRLKNIYYGFDKWNIRADARPELDSLVTIMKAHPELNIELSSHTDSRGKDAYNLWLSDQRARSAVNYIVSKGIERSRLRARGYGETRLLNRCANGITCSEEEHQLNRRTEFIINK